MGRLFYLAAGLVACAVTDAGAAVDQGIHSGEGGGDALGGLVLILLGWGVLKLLASGELIPLARGAAKFLLMIYVPVALWLGALLGVSMLLQSSGLTKEQAGGWAFVVATALTIAVAKWVIGKSDDNEQLNRQPSAEPLPKVPTTRAAEQQQVTSASQANSPVVAEPSEPASRDCLNFCV
jgi:hypothetical protein